MKRKSKVYFNSKKEPAPKSKNKEKPQNRKSLKARKD